jgi:hypothetical protein
MTDPRHLGALELVRQVLDGHEADGLENDRALWRHLLPGGREDVVDELARSCRRSLVILLVRRGGRPAAVAEALGMTHNAVKLVLSRAGVRSDTTRLSGSAT